MSTSKSRSTLGTGIVGRDVEVLLVLVFYDPTPTDFLAVYSPL